MLLGGCDRLAHVDPGRADGQGIVVCGERGVTAANGGGYSTASIAR
jgi:hypothetical protein